jgi:hypothetical protein
MSSSPPDYLLENARLNVEGRMLLNWYIDRLSLAEGFISEEHLPAYEQASLDIDTGGLG